MKQIIKEISITLLNTVIISAKKSIVPTLIWWYFLFLLYMFGIIK